ncbi:hypothetical protein FAES_2508 [Fibrella aestuarina BUZ 2]|uniref:Uncharacterized protein n=1 Tax=Fibrella aestuarina BUZ 2 TaxID=1166018 RepID=I0K8R4_9BACT|nr:hypothetical protein [Fibrella aestuarina]CCH00517.1 hypothetical protein FAES_2508 [Fibrella aestuarina BUZ 2]
MTNLYDCAFSLTGTPRTIAHLHALLNALKPKEDVFGALVGAPPTGSSPMTFYGSSKDVSKQGCDYSLYSPTELIGNFQTLKGLPGGFFLKLSAQYGVRVDVAYDCENDDACGKLVLDEGRLISEDDYTYLHGKYVLDADPEKDDFWYELTIRTEDILLGEYDSAAAIIKHELAFLTDEETSRFVALYNDLTNG